MMKSNLSIDKLSIIENDLLVLSNRAYKVYSSCMYKATMEKYKETMVDFLSVKNNHVYFCMFGDEIIGMVSCSNKVGLCMIVGITTSTEYRKIGVGKLIISYLKQNERVYSIYAETDADAVEFYKKVWISD